jgi:hypothetical protein
VRTAAGLLSGRQAALRFLTLIWRQFQGSSSSNSLAGCSAMRARTSGSQACGSISFILAVTIRLSSPRPARRRIFEGSDEDRERGRSISARHHRRQAGRIDGTGIGVYSECVAGSSGRRPSVKDGVSNCCEGGSGCNDGSIPRDDSAGPPYSRPRCLGLHIAPLGVCRRFADRSLSVFVID